VLAISLIAALAAAAPDDEGGALHAEALAAEIDGNLAGALDLLRRAAAAAPDDGLVVYDLARLAYESKSPTLAGDTAPFLARTPESADAHLLRAYLLLARGERDGAAQSVDAVLMARPGDAEATRLRLVLGGGRPAGAKGEAPLRARVRTSVQGDSNVTVLAEDNPSRLSGARAVLDLALLGRHENGGFALEGGLGASGGPYLNARDDLAAYDAASATLFAAALYRAGGLAASVEVSGTDVLVDAFSEEFMRDVGGSLELRWASGPAAGGLYGGGGWRDFLHMNAEGLAEDRDGPRFEGGVLGSYRASGLVVSGRAGWQRESAEGEAQVEQGLRGGLQVSWRKEALSAGAGVGFEYRAYENVERADLRLMPSARVGWDLNDTFGVVASYAFIRNLSEAPYDYARHLGQAGLEARF
jgi:hypothetical protein